MSNRIILFTFYYPPDQSAGALRSELLAKAIEQEDEKNKIWILCSSPNRFGQWKRIKINRYNVFKHYSQKGNIFIFRLWVPFFGQGPLASVLSYVFYFIQAIPVALFIRPNIILGISAKLITAFLAAISSKVTNAKLFLDIRDTFTDNFFYFYRWKKRIILLGFISLIENLAIRWANSINIVSKGFLSAYYGWENILKQNSTKITFFTNGIDEKLSTKIKTISIENHVKDKFYRVVYAGNLGEAQDLYQLLSLIEKDPEVISRLKSKKIVIHIYGSGIQLNSIKKLLKRNIAGKNNLEDVVYYKGLIDRKEIEYIYKNSDCLFLQLANYNSLSMVIPSKIFEYSSTQHPILYSAKGFTKKFISKINGALEYNLYEVKTFVEAIELSMLTKANLSQRKSFLNNYLSNKIYTSYAKYILSKEN